MIKNSNGETITVVIVPSIAPVKNSCAAACPFPSFKNFCAGNNAVSGVGVFRNIVGIASMMLCVTPMLMISVAGSKLSVVIVTNDAMITAKKLMCMPGSIPVISPIIVPIIIVRIISIMLFCSQQVLFCRCSLAVFHRLLLVHWC